jgi:hypothetical protein
VFVCVTLGQSDGICKMSSMIGQSNRLILPPLNPSSLIGRCIMQSCIDFDATLRLPRLYSELSTSSQLTLTLLPETGFSRRTDLECFQERFDSNADISQASIGMTWEYKNT